MTPKGKTSGIYGDATLPQRTRSPSHRPHGRVGPIAAHKFAIGQSVYYSPGIFESTAGKGVYRIVRLLPAEGRDYQYRIKGDFEGNERVAYESQLTPV